MFNYIKKHRHIIIIAFFLAVTYGVLMNYIVTSNNSASEKIIEVEKIREKDHYEKEILYSFIDYFLGNSGNGFSSMFHGNNQGAKIMSGPKKNDSNHDPN